MYAIRSYYATLLTVVAEPLDAESLEQRPDLASRQKQIEAAREQVKVV